MAAAISKSSCVGWREKEGEREKRKQDRVPKTGEKRKSGPRAELITHFRLLKSERARGRDRIGDTR